MPDLPRRVHLHEEGPREGFQIEAGPIASADKVRFIEALAETGLEEVQCVSFVNPERVPGMADAEEVARAIRKREGVRYTGLWLNLRGMQRAMRTQLDIEGTIGTSASEAFSVRNNGKGLDALRESQRETLAFCVDHGVAVTRGIVTTAFGCNLEGAIAPATVVERVAQMLEVMAEFGLHLPILRLADTVGWAQPNAIASVVGAVRGRWPDLRLGLHLHDTRGTAMANALMGLQMGIDGPLLCARHPRLVYCGISAFGHTGPLAIQPGYEPLIQAFSGLSSINGGPDDPPMRTGASVCDQGTGMWAVIGALALLQRRHVTGRGGVVSASLLETALVWTGQKSDAYANEGRQPDRHRSGHPGFVPRGLQVVPALEYPSVAAAGALVAAGLGITALPRLALQLAHNDDLVTVPLQRPVMSRPIGLVTRAGRSPSPVSRAFMDLLHSREAAR